MLRILVIDDYDFVSDVLEEALTQFGYEVTTASRGLEGFDFFQKGHFDLVITDIVMPDIDGGRVARLIRQSHKPYTPIIGMSGTPWRLENHLFDGVLAKPFTLKALRDMVEFLLSPEPMQVKEPPVPVFTPTASL